MKKARNEWAGKLKKEEYHSLFEGVYLTVVAIYVLKYLLDTTLFDIAWPENFNWTIRIIAAAVVLLKIGNCCEYTPNKMLIIFGTAVFAVMPYIYREQEILLDIVLLMAGAVGVSGRKILKTGFWVSLYALFITVLGSFAGVIQDVIFLGSKGYRHSFGCFHPTDFAIHVFFLVLAGWVLYGGAFLIFQLLLGGAALYLCYCFCESKITAMLLGVLLLFELFFYITENFGKKLRKIGHVLSYPAMFALPAASTVMVVLTVCYDFKTAWLVRLNEMLNSRLSQGRACMIRHDLKIWGDYFEPLIPKEGIDDLSMLDILDSGYIVAMLQFGAVILIWFAFLYILYAARAKKSGQYRLLAAISLVALHGAFQNHLLEIGYNIFLLCGTAQMDFQPHLQEETRMQEKKIRFDKRKLAGNVVFLIIVLATVFLWKPFVMFWRTVWHCAGGEDQVSFLVMGALGMISAALGCRNLWKWFAGKRWSVICQILCTVIFAGVFVYGIVTICSGEEDYSVDILQECEVLRALNEEEGIAVCIDDVPLLYQKEGVDVNYTVFREEGIVDAAEDGKSVLVTLGYKEFPKLFAEDFYYGELSEQHSVYTDDSRAADIMTAHGINMTKFFSSDHTVALETLAEQNEVVMTEDGIIEINGPDQSIWHGPYMHMDQGVIHVEYTLHLTEHVEPEYLALIRIAGYSGKYKLNERWVFANNFDENGNAVIELDVWVWMDMEQAEFLLTATEGTKLELEKITWRRYQ